MTGMAVAPKLVGQPVKRREDPRLITGGAAYTDDIQLDGILHVALVRSPHAHARIRRIGVERVGDLSGVVAVVTGDDVRRDVAGPMPVAARPDGLRLPELYPLALGHVRHAGQPVAAVVATDRYLARDAAELVSVDYEPLPSIIDPEAAMSPNAPRLYDEFPDNIAYRYTKEAGDIEHAFAEADRVVRLRVVNQRVIPLAMETRAVMAHFEPGSGQLTVWASTQVPHLLRTWIAGTLGNPEHLTRVIAPEVGGGFGSKITMYGEDVLVPLLARRLGQPVKWIEDRRENFAGTTHGRGQVDYVDAAIKRDGTVLGLRVRVIADLGAYLRMFTAGVANITPAVSPGCYKIQHFHGEVIGVYTNKTPTDAYRGAGRPEAAFLVERLMDRIANEVGIDPVEVRQRNFIPPDAFPYRTPAGATYDSGNYNLALTRLLELVDYEQFRREQQEASRQQGRYLGIGLSTYVEVCGMGPSWDMKPIGGWESAMVRVHPTGKVTVLTGTSPHGQGQETSFAQIVADQFGIPIQHVVVVHGDTAMVQYGLGTWGSRAIAVGGTAVLRAAEKVREKARRIAAAMLEAAPEDVEFEDGRLFVKGVPGQALAFGQVAREAYRAASLPPDVEPGLEAQFFFDPSGYTYPFGAHACIVEVDQDTGAIDIRRYVAVDDCGRVINPLLVEGQVHGGVAQGIGQALCEEVVYDEGSGQLLTGSLMDYTVPRASMLPLIETARTETPTPLNPLGAKGIGEAGTIAASAAVVNAVIDALRPLGVTGIDMPLRPEKVWRAIQAAKQGRLK
jgi:aerobic carbon-monoxide dehydrogenase large subunit